MAFCNSQPFNFLLVNLIFCHYLQLFLPKELRENLHPPLYDVKHLTIIQYDGVNKSMILDLLDSLLWIAPCLDTLAIDLSCNEKIVKVWNALWKHGFICICLMMMKYVLSLSLSWKHVKEWFLVSIADS